MSSLSPVTDLLKKYPQRNLRWAGYNVMAVPGFVIEASDLKACGYLDPWNRKVPPGDPFDTIERFDSEGDLLYTLLKTTVAGKFVELKIIND